MNKINSALCGRKKIKHKVHKEKTQGSQRKWLNKKINSALCDRKNLNTKFTKKKHKVHKENDWIKK